MAAFRKLILGLAAVTLFAGFANAQNALQCTVNAGVPPTVRAEGLTELVGDVTLQCTGGTPTRPGVQIPASNVTVYLNTNITSRIVNTSGDKWSEAILMIDEPHSTSNPNTPLLACGDANAPELVGAPGVCQITAPATYPAGCVIGGVNVGGQPYNGGINQCGPYTGAAGFPNVFQARYGNGPANVAITPNTNSVTWNGIPFDAPGSTGTRIVRITNIRANASTQLASLTLLPATITMYIAITGSTQVSVGNPLVTVANIQPGLIVTVSDNKTFQGCNGNNVNIANGSSYTAANADMVVRLREGFQSSFKRRNLNFDQYAVAKINNQYLPTIASTINPNADFNQNVPGAVYNTESAFENTTGNPYTGGSVSDPSPNPPVGAGGITVTSTAPFPTIHGLDRAGTASWGTRLALNFTGVQGTTLWVPTVVRLTNQISGRISGVAVMTSGEGTNYSPVSNVASGAGFTTCSAASGFCPVIDSGLLSVSGLAQVQLFNNVGTVVYEVLFSDANSPEQIQVPVAVAFLSSQVSQSSGVAKVNGSFAPSYQTGVPQATNTPTTLPGSAVPSFIPSNNSASLFSLTKCTCNLLFPFVSNILGYDTGVAVINTSLDTGTGFGTLAQAGPVTLNYYTYNGATAPPQQVSDSVPAGQMLLFTLYSGGNFSIAPRQGFQGYIIAQSQFQYCHGYAFITSQGGTALSAASGYIALELDIPGLNRTGIVAEVLGH